MYYDRRLSEPLLDLLRPGAPLGWLPAWVRAPEAARRHARVDFRRNDDDHKLGAVMVYLGRTHPLVAVARPGGLVELDAHEKYRAQAPAVFGTWTRATLPGDAVRALLDGCAVHDTFTTGEGAAHAGLARRYSLDARPGEPVVVDTEARIGFRAEGALKGTYVRDRHEAELRAKHRAFVGASIPWKLDAVVLLADGRLGLVELKKGKGDLVEAVRQAAAHVNTFEALAARGGLDAIDGMVAQKVAVGLLPATTPRVAPGRPVPIVAAPDTDPTWAWRWRTETARVRSDLAPLLPGLRFWRLGRDGTIREDVAA